MKCESAPRLAEGSRERCLDQERSCREDPLIIVLHETDSWPQVNPLNDSSAGTGNSKHGQQGSENESRLPAPKSARTDNKGEIATELAHGVEEVIRHAC